MTIGEATQKGYSLETVENITLVRDGVTGQYFAMFKEAKASALNIQFTGNHVTQYTGMFCNYQGPGSSCKNK